MSLGSQLVRAGRALFANFGVGNFTVLFVVTLLLKVDVTSFFLVIHPGNFAIATKLLKVLVSVLFVPKFGHLRPGRTHAVIFFNGCGNAFGRANFF